MRKQTAISALVVLSAFSVAWTVYDIKPRKKLSFHGTVSEWRAPDARPPGDSLRSASHFYPVAATLYVRRVNPGYRGIMPVCDTIISDSAGNFTTQLEVGDYTLFEPWQLEPLVMPKDSAGIKYDTACIRKQYTEPASKMHFTGDSVKVFLFPKDEKYRRCKMK